MVNHVRTLLLNLDGHGAARGPGEEYIPPEFRAVPLSGPLRAAHEALFGRAPDRALRLLRVRQFLQLLHDTPLAEFVTAADPRLTYLPLATPRAGFDLAPSVAVAGGAGYPLYVGAADGPPPEGDRRHFTWTVEVVA